jgi:uncharacterized protein
MTAVQSALALAVPASDGLELRTDVHRPVGARSTPAVLMRTPYGTTNPLLLKLGRQMACRGFAVVLQNVRGRYGSGGTFEPFVSEGADGAATLRWLAEQSWFNGQVIGFGASYASFTAAALCQYPAPRGVSLVGIVSIASMANPLDYFYRNRVLVLHWALPWCMAVSGPRQQYRDAATLHRLIQAPLECAPRLGGFSLHPWLDWIRHREPGSGFWLACSLLPALLESCVPMLHVGGWYDFGLEAGLRVFEEMRAAAADGTQRLIVGPWSHNEILSTLTDELQDLGRGAVPTILAAELMTCLEGWTSLAGIPPDSPQIRLWQSRAGALGEWQHHRGWHAGAEGTRWYLHGGCNAKTGRLSPGAACDQGPTTWCHDPGNPVPTIGGRCWPMAAWAEAGPLNQADVDAHANVLCYTSEPLSEAVEVTGRPRARLFVRPLEPWVSVVDVLARLCDVARDGRSLWVGEGVHRLEIAAAGKSPYPTDVDLGGVCHRFEAGHRIRICVASSSVPQLECTGESARMHLYHDSERRSLLFLPRGAALA